MTDSRAAAYMDEFGHESWELDALEPAYLVDLITRHVEGVCDLERRQAAVEEQERQRAVLTEAADNWTDVETFLDEEV